MAALDLDQEDESEIEKWIIPEEDFAMLWNSGTFLKMGSISDTNIDDYEDCSITEQPALIKIRDMLSTLLNDPPPTTLNHEPIRTLRDLVALAVRHKTGIFLYL